MSTPIVTRTWPPPMSAATRWMNVATGPYTDGVRNQTVLTRWA
ncbi:hypothetical protein [Kitasatospora azatica]|nr:hypothetical protein [Kitasatospora azatica]